MELTIKIEGLDELSKAITLLAEAMTCEPQTEKTVKKTTTTKKEEPKESKQEEKTKESKQEESIYSLVDVRKALAKAQEGGADIAAIIKSYGATKLSDIDPSNYADIMEKVGAN